MNENPTRERIILLLKKSNPLSIDDLSKQLNITPMGMRQHLLFLERKGVEEITRQQCMSEGDSSCTYVIPKIQ